MTPEEKMRRDMEFIVEHQAQFSENFQRLEGAQEQLTAKLDQLADSQQRAERRTDRLERLARLFVRAGQRGRRDMREQDGRITALIDSQIHTRDEIAALAEIVRQLATKQNGNGKS
jgi:predicted RNase H-like nuclease (RuvC/YqgF family)